MELNKDQLAVLQETVNTPGWAIVQSWFKERDEHITDAIKKNLISLKWDESPKWNAYYSGQSAVVANFTSWVENELNKDLRKKREPKEDQDDL